ncbi:HK97 gp10 family phage protein [Neorhizobium lilium]|uniref:HK97 gp10 family phage protein n=1 Tax=Neorhizobium lilium TaxID=2503024 RepID=A0A3S3SZA8_9HYPH|nr:HK97 gp10 family phage protein [Neorhizobium lilium]RWX78264.1 HK97 gp10 family phage protein [Neorhizobium lilium]
MATLSFAAQIAGWAEKVPEAVEAVRNGAAQDVVKEMQTLDEEGGRLPYETGFLWASLMASTSSMPPINQNANPVDGQLYRFDFGTIEAVIIGADLDDDLYFGYTASYAAAQEYGAQGRAPAGFVRDAVQNWNEHVNRNAKKVRKVFGL